MIAGTVTRNQHVDPDARMEILTLGELEQQGHLRDQLRNAGLPILTTPRQDAERYWKGLAEGRVRLQLVVDMHFAAAQARATECTNRRGARA